MMTYDTFLMSCQAHRPGMRRGQAAFNLLWKTRPDLANQIRSTWDDPFYDDARLPDFYAWVETHWDYVAEPIDD